jgi:tRNA pseudouridine38-40 synthase
MALYQVIIAYDGTNFQGFQRQGSNRTVQAAIEDALRTLGWRETTILYAGRTDSGVHATGQVIAFDLEWNHSSEELGRALNAGLPEDVSVCNIQTAKAGFHPRFNAVARQYHYRLYCQPGRDPLRDRYAWRVWPDVNAALLHQAAECLIGEHDFAVFGSPLKKGGSTTRMIMQTVWQEKAKGEWSFRIIANAFLYRMVRRLVFLQVLVGQQRIAIEDLVAALQKQKPLTPGLAKPNGLYLERVYYSEDRLEPEGLIKTLSASGEEFCG